MNGRVPIIVPSAAEAKQAMISHLPIGCGDFQTIKYASASSSTSLIKKNPLGNFPIRHVIHRPIFGEKPGECKQTPCFLLD